MAEFRRAVIIAHYMCTGKHMKEVGNGKMMFTPLENRKLEWHVYSSLTGEKG
jgi:hypothetical protein